MKKTMDFELFLCDVAVILLHGLKDLNASLYAIKKEENGSFWYSSYHPDYGDICGPWLPVMTDLEQLMLHPIDEYKYNGEKISGVNRFYILEMLRRGEQKKEQLRLERLKLAAAQKEQEQKRERSTKSNQFRTRRNYGLHLQSRFN
ncbi:MULTISPECIES: hypothetical protein [Paenibacillus]|uniref:Uncharacterized protein n=2 Tax=Paenibacillus TaxID=44249 RepID=A0A7Y6BX35_9BACL|nr:MULTISPECIES: hypothetical protein [Paenibacillus]KGP81946.1 hypothetical protein P364_0114070 [Paenibacillus sp. MAEPY2]KGP86032.1 hypothetical protein P363_0119545 [Paenibacillus sp. MAEPY1]MDN4603860.1 hypothetical protein [Paenibacillus vandeheii]NUU75725.1 hypothetical protein [Paenibacillus xylanilyticus]